MGRPLDGLEGGMRRRGGKCLRLRVITESVGPLPETGKALGIRTALGRKIKRFFNVENMHLLYM